MSKPEPSLTAGFKWGFKPNVNGLALPALGGLPQGRILESRERNLNTAQTIHLAAN